MPNNPEVIPFTFVLTQHYHSNLEYDIQDCFNSNYPNYKIKVFEYHPNNDAPAAIIYDKNTTSPSFDLFKSILPNPCITKNMLYINDNELYQLYKYISHSKYTIDKFHEKYVDKTKYNMPKLPIFNQGNYILNNKYIDCFEPHNIKLSKQIKYRVYSFIMHKKYQPNNNILCLDIITNKQKLKNKILNQLKDNILQTFDLQSAHCIVDNLNKPDHYILQFPYIIQKKYNVAEIAC